MILPGRLHAALRRLNPDLPLEAVEEIVRRIERDETPSLVEENRRLHRMIIEGADVQLAQPRRRLSHGAGESSRSRRCEPQ